MASRRKLWLKDEKERNAARRGLVGMATLLLILGVGPALFAASRNSVHFGKCHAQEDLQKNSEILKESAAGMDQNMSKAEIEETSDPLEAELIAMGTRGFIIGKARLNVLGLLAGSSACSAWFEQAGPGPAEKFKSIHYVLDEEGPETILKLQNAENSWFFQQPYIASAFENAGEGSAITINAKGAFFLETAGVRIIPRDGGPGGSDMGRLQHVDIYTGGTLPAQTTTLLHEFAHIVGLLPVDSGFAGAAELSTENTRTVLSHCRTEVEEGAKRISKLSHRLN